MAQYEKYYLFPFLLFWAVLLVLYFCRSWIRAVKLALTLPGPPPLPLIGHALYLANTRKIEEEANTMYRKYGPVVRTWLSIVPIFFVLQPEHIQLILGNKKQTEKSFLYSVLQNFMGEGLTLISGEKWKHHRKLIQPSFRMKILQSHFTVFYKNAERMTEKMKINVNGVFFNITGFINECILDVTHQIVLGTPVKKDGKYPCPFKKGEYQAPVHRYAYPWLLLNLTFSLTKWCTMELKQKATLRDYLRYFLKRKIEERQLGQISDTGCFLSMMMEASENNNNNFTVDEMLDEVGTFILAGQETVATAIAFIVYNLAKHPQIQRTAAEELEQIFGNSGRCPDSTDLNKMEYLDACIKETLRLYPSAPMFLRELSEDVNLGDITLPVGSNVALSPYVTHRIPKYFPNPLKFDPSRFTQENSEKIHPFAYFPFSLGPRNCIGYKFALLEMKVIVSSILRKYQIELVPGHELKLSYRVLLRLKGGLWVKLKRRI